MKSQPKYKFYPSLLDSFQRYLDTTAEDYLYYSESDGKYHRNYNEATGTFVYSQEEVDYLLRQDLLDTINRVPHESSEAADRGTAFNDIIDHLLGNSVSKTDLEFRSSYDIKHETGSLDIEGKPDGYDCYVERIEKDCVKAEIGGHSFLFDGEFCKTAASYFTDSLSQIFVSAPIETKYGTVELYGYIDELRRDKVYDIKTTSSYQFGKYKKGWQRHVYPYCLIESGKVMNIVSFEYTAYVLRRISGTPLITGQQFPEEYTYNHQQSTEEIRNFCERFIQFLEDNREYITDKKIFNNA